MSAVSKPDMICFHHPDMLPEKFDAKFVSTTKPLLAGEEWKSHFLIGKEPIDVERIRDCLVKGPFIAQANLGPKFYSIDPQPFKNQITTFPDMIVYGWKGGNRLQREIGAYSHIIVCGVKRRQGREHVYYLVADESELNLQRGTAKYKATTDRVYVAAVKTFSHSVFMMYPRVQKDERSKLEAAKIVERIKFEKAEKALRKQYGI